MGFRVVLLDQDLHISVRGRPFFLDRWDVLLDIHLARLLSIHLDWLEDRDACVAVHTSALGRVRLDDGPNSGKAIKAIAGAGNGAEKHDLEDVPLALHELDGRHFHGEPVKA